MGGRGYRRGEEREKKGNGKRGIWALLLRDEDGNGKKRGNEGKERKGREKEVLPIKIVPSPCLQCRLFTNNR